MIEIQNVLVGGVSDERNNVRHVVVNLPANTKVRAVHWSEHHGRLGLLAEVNPEQKSFERREFWLITQGGRLEVPGSQRAKFVGALTGRDHVLVYEIVAY